MQDRNTELDGKVAIVTGAAGAIGSATARILAEAGARVVLTDLATSPLEDTAAGLASSGLQAVAHPVDIADEASVEELIRFTLDRFDRLDILDNNAASQGHAADTVVTELSGELWDRIMGVNARGTMFMCKHGIPAMIASGGGSIVNISSGTSLGGDFFATAYACSKGAINTLTRYVATQYGAQGIRCNALVLGLVKTPKLESALPPPVVEIYGAHKSVGRLGEPVDIAEMVRFLASDRSTWITGQLFSIDGGFFSHIPATVQVASLMRGAGTA